MSKKNKKVTVRISRAKWSRGHDENALLLKESHVADTGNKSARRGNMCCLGFACLALGAKKKDIRGHGLPSALGKLLTGLTEKFCNPWSNGSDVTDTQFAQDAADLNDDQNISNKAREKKLRKLADKNGFKFVFVP